MERLFYRPTTSGRQTVRFGPQLEEETMKQPRISRRAVVKGSLMAAAAGGTAAFYGPWHHNTAFAQAKPIKLGLTNDASGQFGNSGQDDHRAIRMAIDEVNAKGGVLGRKVIWVTADTESTPATGTRVAERFITREDCSILIGALHSGVANAITQVANKYGTIYLNTNSSAPSEAGENCSRVKFVWDGNGTNFSKAAVKNAVQSIGKNWLLLTNDYVWGHSTAAATKAQVEANGGKIIDNLLVPQNTRDFTSYLLKVQQIKPDVVGLAVAGDDNKALREQIAQLKLDDSKPAWINNQQDWPDVWGAPQTLFGVFGTTWYHKLPLPGVAEFGKRWADANKGGPIPVPGNVSYNGYMATRELFRAMERAGSTNNVKVIKELETLKVPAADRMQHHDAYMNPATHQMEQTVYLARRNRKPADNTDHFEILSWAEPKAVTDDVAPTKCKLIPYEQVPTVDA
jgi:branched-chain amino acid transport system substrate-binding protein